MIKSAFGIALEYRAFVYRKSQKELFRKSLNLRIPKKKKEQKSQRRGF
jgi:hypothetical protein